AAVVAEEAVVLEHPEHLLEEERVALRRLDDAIAIGRVERRRSEKVADEGRALLGRERREHHRVCRGLHADPTGTELQQLGPREAEERYARVARPAREVLDEDEEDRLRPVDVVEE